MLTQGSLALTLLTTGLLTLALLEVTPGIANSRFENSEIAKYDVGTSKTVTTGIVNP